MPLIDTQNRTTIHEIVRETLQSQGPQDMREKLDEAFLSESSLLESLRSIVETGQSDSVRLNAIQTALKMHGSLQERPMTVPTVNITINGTNQVLGVNPILLPRELQHT